MTDVRMNSQFDETALGSVTARSVDDNLEELDDEIESREELDEEEDELDEADEDEADEGG